MNFRNKGFFPVVGVIITIIGIGLISVNNINSYLNQPDYVLYEKEIAPGDFRLGDIELQDNNEVGVLATYGPGDDSSIKISILSKDNSIIWEKHHDKQEGGKIFLTFVNTDAGKYVVKTTNTGNEPIQAFVSISNLKPDDAYLDPVDAYFMFEVPGKIILGIGVILLLIGLPIFFYEKRKSQKNSKDTEK